MPDTMETMTLVTAALAGALLGAFYFGGLWWTVRRMPRVRHPLTLYFGSLAGRLAVVVVALYGVLTLYDWPQLVTSLVGFIAMRTALVRLLGQAPSGDAPARRAVR